MRKQNLIIGAALMGMATLITTSCTSEDNFEILHKETKAEVKFSTNISAMSRAISTAQNLNSFKTSAYLQQGTTTSMFMNDVAVNKNDDGTWKTDGYFVWPYQGTITFYSVAPTSLLTTNPDADAISDEQPSFEFTASSDAATQTDVLYAVNANHEYTGTEASSVVNVNFRHALSQIVFKAMCENENWRIDISDVKIHNVKSSGVYTLPTETTLPLSNENIVRGSWKLGSEINSYNTGIPEAKLNIGTEVVEITSSTNLPLLMIPQTTAAWNPAIDPKCEQNGSYFTIRCQLRQKTADNKEIIIWPRTGENAYVDVAVPVSVNWQEGKKYTYTFNIKDGAGYIPPTQTDGGSDLTPGSVVVNPISFSVKIDDFGKNDNDILM